MTWLDSGVQRSKVEVTAGRRVGEGMYVDAGTSKSIFYIVNFLGRASELQ